MLAGMQVVGPGIPAGATIATVVSATAIDLSVAATASASGVALTVGNMAVFLRSTAVPDTDSLFSAEVQGNTGLTNVRFSQDIQGDLGATLRNPCTFSGYLYNGTGVTLSPQLIISSANAFNNFSARTDVSSTNLQSCPNATWTYVTDTVDLTSLPNIANGFSVVVSFTGLDAPTKNVLFSRLKFQAGQVATPFTDDVSLFVQAPSVDSTMLQDGCIARTGLFLSNVIPAGAYTAKSVVDANLADNTILARSLSTGKIVTTGNTNSTINVTNIPSTTGMLTGMAISGSGIPAGATIASVISGTAITLSVAASTSVTGVTLTVTAGTPATVGNLGYTPENKAGDNCTGVHFHVQDTVVGSTAFDTSAVVVESSAANANNDGYFPSIGFWRYGISGRTIGLTTDRRFKTVDDHGTVGYLLDTVTGVDTNSYQNASITYAKLAQSLINAICPTGMVICFAGPNIPANWAGCDGSQLSRTSYPALFAAIGVYWGAGDGVNTFNLPNFQGRAPVGYVTNANQSGISSRGFAALGGEETHHLLQGEMPAHAHTLNENPHTHTYTNPAGNYIGFASGGMSLYSPAGVAQTGGATTQMTMNNTGSDTPHNNMMPFAVAYYIIKVL
jgi:microcystin-dependent protein